MKKNSISTLLKNPYGMLMPKRYKEWSSGGCVTSVQNVWVTLSNDSLALEYDPNPPKWYAVGTDLERLNAYFTRLDEYHQPLPEGEDSTITIAGMVLTGDGACASITDGIEASTTYSARLNITDLNREGSVEVDVVQIVDGGEVERLLNSQTITGTGLMDIDFTTETDDSVRVKIVLNEDLSHEDTAYVTFKLDKFSHPITLTHYYQALQPRLVTTCGEVKDLYRFGFNGIHKENEVAGVGNHYSALFGEYNPRIVYRWNTDPKPTIGISPYAMFKGNPIWYKDPLLDDPNDPIGSLAKLARSAISLYHSAQVVFGVVAHVADKVNTAAKYVNKHTTPAQRQSAQLTAEFMFGFGPQVRHLDESSPITQDLMKSKLTAQARAAFYAQNKEALGKGQYDKIKLIENKLFSFGLKGLTTEGGNAQQFVGSATYSISLSSDHKTLNYEIYNETSEKSLFYHLPIDNHTRAENPVMGTTKQTYEFSEPVQVPKTDKK